MKHDTDDGLQPGASDYSAAVVRPAPVINQVAVDVETHRRPRSLPALLLL